MKIKGLVGYADDLRYKSDDKMDQDAAPHRLVFLVKISCSDTQNGSAEHHGKFIAHMEYEEEKTRHPD